MKGILTGAIRRHWAILVLLVVGLVIGVVIGRDYGISYDETLNAGQGEAARMAYLGSDQYFSLPYLADHGPIYFMVFSAMGDLVHGIAPSWKVADGRHLTNYMTFLVGVFLLYRLSDCLMNRRAAWMTAALFVSQPLLFGNAFINQKDIPFMTLFLGSVVLGIEAADLLPSLNGGPLARRLGNGASKPRRLGQLTAEWRSASLRARIGAVGASALLILFVVDMFVVGGLFRLGESLVTSAYQGTAPGFVQEVFNRTAANVYNTPLAAYLEKHELLFGYLQGYGSSLLFMIAAITWSLCLPSVADAWGFGWGVLRSPAMIAAGLVLGATICIRQVGLFGGLLVALYFLYRFRRRALFPLTFYGLLAFAVLTVTWPLLWGNPAARFVSSLLHVAQFPTHHALFFGQMLLSTSLPWTYFPVLVSLELTEIAVVLIIAGIFLTLWRYIRKKRPFRAEFGIIGLWIAVPLALLLASGMSVYHNVRQLLFLLPALFVFAGLTMEKLISLVRWRWMMAVVLGVALVPALVADVELHPYEYVYFNRFIGGVDGADGQFGLDYWCVSLREGVEHVDSIAGPGALVQVGERLDLVAPYARPDLVLTNDVADVPLADYIVNCAYRTTATNMVGFTNVYDVTRGEAVLTSVWRRNGSVK